MNNFCDWLIANGISFKEKDEGQLTIYNNRELAIARVFPNEDKFIMDIALEDERYGIDDFKFEILNILKKL